MYQGFYGLREMPFEITADPKFLYFTAGHREALSNIEYGLTAARTLTVLVGEAGTGKTTLLRASLDSDRCRHITAIHIKNPTLTRNEFVEMLARSFDLSARAATSKAAFLIELERALLDRRSRGEMTALVIDEAQSLSDELLEEIRLLANIETPAEKLLPLILAGQPELAVRLNDQRLRQLKQRVALRCEIAPLTLLETAAYIVARIETAGSPAGRLFTREAVAMIHEYSRGVPRTINVMCDNALLSGFAMGRKPVNREIVVEVCRDFDLRRASGASSSPALLKDAPSETESPSIPAVQLVPVERRREERPVRPRGFSTLGLSV